MEGDPELHPREIDATSDHSPSDEASTIGFEADVTLGTTIGAYKLLRPIGEGGFGSVYAAEQERPVRRLVALKLIKIGMDTRQVVARFEQERQALAMMDHPHIARVFDAGATETGRPYFVMELVRGEKITTFADRQRLTVRQRLELFVQTCRAVQHAHQKGVIHRDLKPSNVLAGTEDGEHSVKVIDFGVAKATAARLTERTLYTEQRQIIGTPEYMSPEQAEGSPDIDTRTDVYALGVLLYELLTGSTPFAERKLGLAPSDEVQRIIREVEPVRPSTRIGKSERARDVAASRQSDPQNLVSAVRGELDWIVLKALDKDRSRRYDSASALAADIERYLHGDPVNAAPPSVVYRARKFIRRHRGPVAAVALVAASLLLGIAATTFVMFRALAAEREQSKLRTAAELARKDEARARRRAEASNQFLQDMLTAADPGANGREMTVREVTDQATRDLERAGEVRDPHVEMFVRSILGRTYRNIGALDDAERLLRSALTIATSEFGAESDEALDVQLDLAFALALRDQMQAADQLAERTLESYRRKYPPDDARIGRALKVLSSTRYRLTGGEASEPLELARQATQILRKHSPGDDPQIAELLQQQAFLLNQLGREKEAEPLAQQALTLAEARYGPKHYTTLSRLMALADIQFDLQKYDDSERTAQKAVDLAREVYGESHTAYSDALWRVASCAQKRQRPEAEAMLKQIVEIRRAKLGRHTETALALATLGQWYDVNQRLDEARAAIEESLAIRREVMGPRNPAVASSLSDLGAVDRKQQRYDEAIAHLHEARDTFLATLGEDTDAVVPVQFHLAMTYQAQGDLAQAEAVFRERLARVIRTRGERSYSHGQALDNLAPVLFKQNRVDESLAMMREALAIYEEALGKTHPDLRNSVGNIAFVLKSQGRLDEALEHLQRLVALCREVYGDASLETASALLQIAEVQQAQQQWQPALEAAREAVSIRQERIKPEHPLAWQVPSSQAVVVGLLADRAADDALGRSEAERAADLTEADEWLQKTLSGMEPFADAFPAQRRREILGIAAQLYETRDRLEPEQGFAAKAAEFRDQLAALPAPSP